jgi:hypothetical protein
VRARALIAAALAAGVTAVGGVVGVAGAAFTDAGATTHASFAAAAEFPPVVKQVPTILGAAQGALPLHATSGSFAPAATSATYAWLRCDAGGANCAALGASGADYTPVAADVGKTLRVDMTPLNGSAAGATVRSEPSNAVLAQGAGPSIWAPVVTNTPTITGTATVGQALSGTTGTWVQLLGVTQWQWERCDATGAACVAIAGATSQNYTATAADRGRRLMLAVTVNVLNLAKTTANTDTTAIVA